MSSPGNNLSSDSQGCPAHLMPSPHSVNDSSTTRWPFRRSAMIVAVSSARARGEVTTVASSGRRSALYSAWRRPVGESENPGRSA